LSSASQKAGDGAAPNEAESRTSDAAAAFFDAAKPSGGGEEGGFEAQVARFARRSPGWRSPTLMLLVIGVCGWLMWSMWPDLEYFLAEPEPVHLGNEEGYDLSRLEPNTYVAIEGLPSLLQAQYKQFGQRYKVHYLIGTRVFVREPLIEGQTRDVDDYPTFEGVGRVLDLNAERSFQNVRTFFHEKGRFDFSRPAWIILADAKPRQAWWVPIAYVALVAIGLLNVGLLLRRLRRR
jgi:hypothetical protein